MSDPISQPTAPVPSQAPSPAIDPAAPPASTGSGPNQIIFEQPAAATPATPEPLMSEDWGKVFELENGQYEMTLNSGQTYKGTHQEILREAGKAQYNATRRIAELNGKQVPPSTHEALQPGQVDPTALALADLVAQGVGLKNAEEMKNFLSNLPTIQENFHTQQMNQIASSFLAATPDFPNSDENAGKVDATLAKFGMEPSLESLQMVHHYLKNTGQYARVNTPAKAPTSHMPTPPNGYSAPAEGFDPWLVPLEQLGDHIRRQ